MANAIGLFTKDTNWTPGIFNFIAGYAGQGYGDTPSNLKAIDEKAASEKIPFFLWYEFDVEAYSVMQYDAHEQTWPSAEKDELLQKLIPAMRNRNIAGVIISVMTNTSNLPGGGKKVEMPAYISFAAKMFVGRVSDWLRAYRGVRLIVASSNQFISTKASQMNNWVGEYTSCAVQPTTKPLAGNAYPSDPNEKPQYLGARNTCEFWRFYEMSQNKALILYRQGDKDALYNWLGFDTGTPPVPPTPPPPTVGDYEVTLPGVTTPGKVKFGGIELPVEGLDLTSADCIDGLWIKLPLDKVTFK